MSDFIRGHETFWNKSVIGFQNIFRLFSIALISGLIAMVAVFTNFVASTYWRGLKVGFRLFWEKIKADKFLTIRPQFDVFLSYNWRLLYELHGKIFLVSVAVGLLTFFLIGILGYFYFRKRGGKLVSDNHLRGARLVGSAKEFNREMLASVEKERREIKRDGGKPPPVKILVGDPFIPTVCKAKIPETFLSRHIAAIGASGTGKSTLLKHKMEHAYANGRKGIVLDFNGEIYSEFGRDNDVVLSLFDTRSALWDFSFEKIPPSKLASFLIPEMDGNEFWWKGSRKVLTDLISEHKTCEKIWSIVNDPTHDLKQSLPSGLARRTIGDSAGQSSGIEGTMMLNLSFLEFINCWAVKKGKTEKFSVFDWAQNDDTRWIYVVVNEADAEAANPLIQLWFNLAILGLIQRPANSALPKMAIILDELSSIPKLELLPKVPDLSRKYGGEGFFGFQSPKQILSIYGQNSGMAILAGLQTKFIFNIPDPIDAEALAGLLGKEEIKRKSASLSYSASTVNDRETLGESVTLRSVALGSEIMALADGHCFIKCRNLNALKTRIIKRRWPRVRPLYSETMKYPKTYSGSSVESRVTEDKKPPTEAMPLITAKDPYSTWGQS